MGDGKYENKKPWNICTIISEPIEETRNVKEEPPLLSSTSVMWKYLIKIYRKNKEQ